MKRELKIIQVGDITIRCAHTELVDINKIVANPRNPNTHPERQIELLAKIIRAQGFRRPITVSRRSGFVIVGHGRLAAARVLGMESVPVDFQDYANEAEEWADMLADNQLAELAEIDKKALSMLLADLEVEGLDLELTGFSEDELDELLSDDSDPISEGASSSQHNELLKFDGLSIPLTDGERANLRAKADAHAEKTGSYFGFVTALLGGGDDDV